MVAFFLCSFGFALSMAMIVTVIVHLVPAAVMPLSYHDIQWLHEGGINRQWRLLQCLGRRAATATFVFLFLQSTHDPCHAFGRTEMDVAGWRANVKSTRHDSFGGPPWIVPRQRDSSDVGRIQAQGSIDLVHFLGVFPGSVEHDDDDGLLAAAAAAVDCDCRIRSRNIGVFVDCDCRVCRRIVGVFADCSCRISR